MIELIKIPDSERGGCITSRLGNEQLALVFEQLLYSFSDKYLGDQYTGGWWDIYTNSDGLLYMECSSLPKVVMVNNPENGFRSTMLRRTACIGICRVAMNYATGILYERGVLSDEIVNHSATLQEALDSLALDLSDSSLYYKLID